jgi:hypothetical protein
MQNKNKIFKTILCFLQGFLFYWLIGLCLSMNLCHSVRYCSERGYFCHIVLEMITEQHPGWLSSVLCDTICYPNDDCNQGPDFNKTCT